MASAARETAGRPVPASDDRDAGARRGDGTGPAGHPVREGSWRPGSRHQSGPTGTWSGERGTRGGAAPRTGRPDRGSRGTEGTADRPARRAGRTADRRSGPRDHREGPALTTRPRIEAPALPDEATPELLDLEVRKELRGLPIGLAEVVARHLVAAAMVLDDDPALALAHARTAASLAARLPVTREAAGIAAYHAGEYATALVELRTARRMDGSARYLPMIADAERGLGRPERAVTYLTDPAAEALDPAGRAELLIVGSGARRDLGQPEAAVVLLQDEATRPGPPRPWTARLRYAYAEALLDADRPVEALRAFEAAAAIDDEGETDADERAYELMTAQLAADSAGPVGEGVSVTATAVTAAVSRPAPAAASGSEAAPPGSEAPPSSEAATASTDLPESSTPTDGEAVPGETSAGDVAEPGRGSVADGSVTDDSGSDDSGSDEDGPAGVGKGVTPVLFDDGSSSLARFGTAGAPAADETDPARPQASRAGGLPDLSVLFSDLGLREIPVAERQPLAQDEPAGEETGD